MKVNLIKDSSVSKEVFTEVFEKLNSVAGPIRFSCDHDSLVAYNDDEYFEREIIQFCFSKKSLSYYEIKWQFHYDVLANDQAINENLMGKFFRRDIIN